MEQKENGKKMIGLIVGIAVFALTSFGVKKFFFASPTFDMAMMEAASELNKSCPIMVDSETRLDNAVAMPNNVFQYNYTLVKLSRDEVDTALVHENLDLSIINNVKTSPDLKIYRDNNVTMAYYYKDKDGQYLLRLNVSPELYK